MVMRNNGSFTSNDLAGVRNGYITAIRPTGAKHKDGSYIWLMRCDCGKEFERAASRFRRAISCGCAMMANSGQFEAQSLEGLTVNDCTAIAPTELRTSGGYIIWRVRCNLCNEEFERPSYALLRKTISHMCPEWWAIHGHERKTGRPPIPNSGAHVNGLFSHYRQAAKQRGIPFTLTKDDARALFEGNCAYCGVQPSNNWSDKNLAGEYVWNGIDRVDNSLGYTLDNCVSCCTACNFAKGSRSAEEFKQWIWNAYKYLFP